MSRLDPEVPRQLSGWIDNYLAFAIARYSNSPTDWDIIENSLQEHRDMWQYLPELVSPMIHRKYVLHTLCAA